MFPTFYENGALMLHSWGLMVTLAFVAAFLVVHLRAPKVGVDPDQLVPMYLLLAAAGMVTPWMAAAGMTLSSLLVVTNALRLGASSTGSK